MRKGRWIHAGMIMLLAATIPLTVYGAKLNAKLVKCKKTKIRNSDKALVYQFIVQSREASLSGKTESVLYVEVRDAKQRSYFGTLRNKIKLISMVRGGSYADAHWRFEVNVDQLDTPILTSYYVELLDSTNDEVLDTKKHGVGNFEHWKATNAKSAPLMIKALETNPGML